MVEKSALHKSIFLITFQFSLELVEILNYCNSVGVNILICKNKL